MPSLLPQPSIDTVRADAESVLQSAAFKYSAAGLATLPVNKAKKQTLYTWKQYEETKPNDDELRIWFGGSDPQVVGLAIIAGKISGNIEVIDIDCKYDLTGSLMEDFCALLKEHLPELFPKLVIAKTINKGFHILVRVPISHLEGNKKLAKRPATDEEKENAKKNGKQLRERDLIETRGEGGYFVAAPTTGYEWTQGSFENIPLITAKERETIFTIARSFDQMPVDLSPEDKKSSFVGVGGLSPFDDYNARADVPELLERHGWRFVSRSGDRMVFKRPGTTDNKSSGNFHAGLRIFYVFTTSTAFESGRGYNPTQVYARLEHGNNFSAASHALYADGYGSRGPIINKAKQSLEEIKADILDGKLVIAISSAERGKCRISAKTGDGKETIAKDVFNLSEADKRNKFIKQIETILPLSSDEKTNVARELLKLADASESLAESAEVVQNNGEIIETNFQVLKDSRIVEQIYDGFAIYDPETDSHTVAQSISDSDGTTYTPIDDELFTKKGGIYLAETLTEYGTEAELVADVEKYLSTYLDLKPLFLKLTALYILFTYIFDSDSILELSYLNATGDAGSGKSRFGLAVCIASHRGLSLITPSAASLYRIVDKFQPTLFLDEFNSDVNSDDAAAIIQILNAGFQQTAQIPRQVATADGKYKTEMFNPFCPKIIGSLKQSASNAFNSRCIEIQMERTIRNDIPLRLSRKLLNAALMLRNKLTLWRMRNIQTDFDAKLDQAERELRASGIMPRSIQINIPLFALINDEKLKSEFVALLQGRDVLLNDEKQQTFDGELVRTLHTILFDVEQGADNKPEVRWSDAVGSEPADGEICEHLRIEKITSMLNYDRPQKDQFNTRYIGKKIGSFALRSEQILKRSSNFHKKSAIIFDAHRLKVIFKNYGLPLPSDFSLDRLDQNDKTLSVNSLTWSKDVPDQEARNSLSDQSNLNVCNNKGESSNRSKENLSGEAMIENNGNFETESCQNCGIKLSTYLNEIYCPLGCESRKA